MPRTRTRPTPPSQRLQRLTCERLVVVRGDKQQGRQLL
jgi:hypothetical protein